MTEEAYIKRLELENKVLTENYANMGGRQATLNAMEFMLARVMYNYTFLLQEVLRIDNQYISSTDVDHQFYKEMSEMRDSPPLEALNPEKYKKILNFIQVIKEKNHGK